MLIPTSGDAPEWISENASELKSFIASDTGQKLLELLSYNAPNLLDGGDVNKTLVASGKLDGFMSAVDFILGLRTHRPPEATPKADAYPSLDDDSKWPTEAPEPTPNT